MPHRDLSPAEQEHVRVCLRALRARFDSWRNVERSLPLAHSVLVDVMSGRSEVSVAIAFRAARVLGASIYDVIAGARAAGRHVPQLRQGVGRALAVRVGRRSSIVLTSTRLLRELSTSHPTRETLLDSARLARGRSGKP